MTGINPRSYLYISNSNVKFWLRDWLKNLGFMGKPTRECQRGAKPCRSWTKGPVNKHRSSVDA
jgi:hypothetical protein